LSAVFGDPGRAFALSRTAKKFAFAYLALLRRSGFFGKSGIGTIFGVASLGAMLMGSSPLRVAPAVAPCI